MIPGEKVLLLTSGGDWYDASANTCIILSGCDPHAENERYKSLGGWMTFKMHFMEWLIHEGKAREMMADDPFEHVDESF